MHQMLEKPEKYVITAEIFEDIMKSKEELDLAMESIEIMNSSDAMKSIKKSQEQIKLGKTRSFNDFLKEKREKDGLNV